MKPKKTEYSAKQIQAMRTKLLSRDYSESWVRLHIWGMMERIEELESKLLASREVIDAN